VHVDQAEDSDEKAPRRGLPSGFTTLRDIVSYLAGMVVIGHEVFFTATIEVYAIGVGLALLGLPLVFSADERKHR
jgi:hypothetical protein